MRRWVPFAMAVTVALSMGEGVSAETTVTPDPIREAIIIDGFEPASAAEIGEVEPCIEYVLVPQAGVLPADSVVPIPCRENANTISRVSDELRERVIRYLPPQRPRLWPPTTALVNLPMVAASRQQPVRLHARVLGEQITIDLAPIFHWAWGDGRTMTTALPGRPYPAKTITHTYRRTCQCTVELETAWSGTWAFSDGTPHALGAVLRQHRRIAIAVRNAPIRLTR